MDWKILITYTGISAVVGLFGAFVGWLVVGIFNFFGIDGRLYNLESIMLPTIFITTFFIVFALLCLVRINDIRNR